MRAARGLSVPAPLAAERQPCRYAPPELAPVAPLERAVDVFLQPAAHAQISRLAGQNLAFFRSQLGGEVGLFDPRDGDAIHERPMPEQTAAQETAAGSAVDGGGEVDQVRLLGAVDQDVFPAQISVGPAALVHAADDGCQAVEERRVEGVLDAEVRETLGVEALDREGVGAEPSSEPGDAVQSVQGEERTDFAARDAAA